MLDICLIIAFLFVIAFFLLVARVPCSDPEDFSGGFIGRASREPKQRDWGQRDQGGLS